MEEVKYTRVTEKQLKEALKYLYTKYRKDDMTLNDPELARIVKNRIPVTLLDKEFYVEKSPLGTCDGCYFLGKQCPQRAVTYCTSNGGNILVEVKPNDR